ncbi:MAG: hypothetical protein LQ338_001057 [Usnochroma carphineum]|nr:MAG: hypothetical protein LQ338_001057 [Usnochroma carphineum]
MRSMFPRYNPTVPLAQQRYYPQIHINPTAAKTAAEAADSGSYSPSLYAQQEPSRNGQKTPLPKGLGLFDAGKLAEESRDLLDLSTPDELVDLWALANGQTSQKATKEYGLELSCDDLDAGQGIICFGSSTSRSLYSLSAIDDELSISRSHPINDTTTIQVSAPTLQNPSSTSPLIATVFPKLAELMAIDKSSSVAVEHKLDRKESAALQTEALERAYRKEASTLLWDSESQKYYLIHPTLLEDDSPAAIPIQVSSAVGTPRELKIFAPDRTDKPLLELSFETLHLNIHTEAITSYSSLHLLDTLLSTTLVLLLHLHRSRPSPSLRPSSPATSAIPVFDPPPLHPKTTNKKERRLTSWSKSFFTRSTAEEKRQQVDDGESATAVTIRVERFVNYDQGQSRALVLRDNE